MNRPLVPAGTSTESATGAAGDASGASSTERQVPGIRAGGLPCVVAAIAAIARGEVVVVVDDKGRESEGDLTVAADFATPETMAFFVRHTSGLIGVGVTEERADELRLPLMVAHNPPGRGTAFAVTVDAVAGITTGISAVDRSTTVRALVAPGASASDLARPGHVHVLRSRSGGVLARSGHTEAAVDLARLAGLTPAGVVGEIVSTNSVEMAGRPELARFAADHDLQIIAVADLIRHRILTETLIRRTAEAGLPTLWGEFRALSYANELDGGSHLAFVRGDTRGAEKLLVQVHNECVTGDVFRSVGCDCRAQLAQAMAQVASEAAGVVIYLRGQAGKGTLLAHQLQAGDRQDRRLDTSDNLDHWVGAQILADLGVASTRSLTNNLGTPQSTVGLGLR